MPNIDSLEIEVKSSSTDAASGLDKLKSSLDKLKRALNGNDYSGLGTLAATAKNVARDVGDAPEKLTALANAMKAIKQVGKISLSASVATQINAIGLATRNIEYNVGQRLGALASGLQSIADVGTVKISSTVGTGITSISTAIANIDPSSLSRITAMASSLSSLSSIQGLRIPAGLADEIRDLGTAAQTLAGIDLTPLTTLASSLKPLTQLGTTKLSSIFNQLERLPAVMSSLQSVDMDAFTDSVNRLVSALDPLATKITQLSGSLSTLPGAIESTNVAMGRMANSSRSGIGSMTDLYSVMRMAYSGIKRVSQVIAGAINESNTYIESLNLFNASMGKYSDAAYEYAQTISDAVGIDMGEWMRNQGVFMTLGTGFGIAADRAYTMSQQLTQLGYDLSSFFNLPIQESFQKLQSGFAGELEPLRRLGYDLSETRLKAIALKLGIETTYEAMTQAEKAQLRYYAMMTQVTTAQGDMARTLNSPANQLRILQAQITQATRAFGNTFIPILNAVLPYLIAVAKACRIVAASIAQLFGFELPAVDYSGITAGIEDVAGGISDIGKNANKSGGAAKKLKSYLMGFDELNVIDPNSGSGGGGSGGSASGLGSNWDWDLPIYDFLDGLVESRVNEWFEKLKPGVEWIQEHLQSLLTIGEAIGSMFLAWAVAKKLIPNLRTAGDLLSKITSWAAAIATALITVTFEYKFVNAYLKTGDAMDLVGSAITTALGSMLVGKLVANATGNAGYGLAGAGATILLTSLVDVGLTTGEVLNNGLSPEALIADAIGIAKAGISIAMLLKGLKFTQPIAGAMLGMGLVAAVSLFLMAGKAFDDGQDWNAVLLAAAGAAATGIAGAGLASLFHVSRGLGFGIGMSIGASVGLLLAAGKAYDNGVYWESALLAAAGAAAAGIAGCSLASTLHVSRGFGFGIGFGLAATVALWIAAGKAKDSGSKWGDLLGDAALLSSGLVVGSAIGQVFGAKRVGAVIGFGVSAIVNLISEAGKAAEKGNGWDALLKDAAAVAVGGLTAASVAKMLGVAGSFMALGGIGMALTATVALAVTAAAVVKYVTMTNQVSKFGAWGSVVATKEELTEMLNSMVKVDLTATANIVDTTVEGYAQARASMDEKMLLFESTLQPIRLGVTVDDRASVYADLKDQLMGEGGILASFQAQLTGYESMVKLAVTLDEESGSNLDRTSLLQITTDLSAILNGEFTRLGEELAGYYDKGMLDQLEGTEKLVADELAARMIRIQKAYTHGVENTQALEELKHQLHEYSGESYAELLGMLQRYESDSVEMYRKQETELKAALGGVISVLEQEIEEREKAGEKVDQLWRDQLEDAKTKFKEWDIEAIATEKAKAASEGATAILLERMQELMSVGEGYLAGYLTEYANLGSQYLLAASGVWDENTITELAKEFAGTLGEGMKQIFGEGNAQVILSAPEVFGVEGWDLYSEETKQRMLKSYVDVFGGEATIAMLNYLGMSVPEYLAEGVPKGQDELDKAMAEQADSAVEAFETELNHQMRELTSVSEGKIGTAVVDAMNNYLNDSLMRSFIGDDNYFSVDSLASEFKTELENALKDTFGEGEADFYLNAPDIFGVSGWDMFSEEIKQQMLQPIIDILGEEGTVQMLNQLGMSIPTFLTDGMTANLTLVTEGTEAIRDEIVETIENGKVQYEGAAEGVGESINIGLGRVNIEPVSVPVEVEEPDPVNVEVGLEKYGWTDFLDWLGELPVIGLLVNLIRDGWTSFTEWLGKIPIVQALVDLVRNGWTSFLDWIGKIPIIGALVNLLRNGWDTVGGWIGKIPILGQLINLVKNGWTSYEDWFGVLSPLLQLIGIGRGDGWKGKTTWQSAWGFAVDAVSQLIGIKRGDSWKGKTTWQGAWGFAVSAVRQLIGIKRGDSWKGQSTWQKAWGFAVSTVSQLIGIKRGTSWNNQTTWQKAWSFATPVANQLIGILRGDGWNGKSTWQQSFHFENSTIKGIVDLFSGNFKHYKNPLEYLGIKEESTAKVSVDLEKGKGLGATVSGALVNLAKTAGLNLSGLWATGGFPPEGQMFVAREAGPELVGSIGRRTAVANNDQIVAGIESGVSNANAAVVDAINTLIGVVQSKDMSVALTDDDIGRSYDRYNLSRGARVNSGTFANAH